MTALQMIRHGIPAPLKRLLRRGHRDLKFRRALHRVSRLPAGATPAARDVMALVYGWGNEGYSASADLVREILASAAMPGGPILECGSGLSTLLLGLAARQNRRPVLSLEHDPGWARRVRAKLARLRVEGVEVCFAPLRTFESYSWYDIPIRQLPTGIHLVVCDGPPGDTPGGRYGMLPRVRSRLAPGCIILLDDAGRPGEQQVLERWADELGCGYAFAGFEKPYARLTVPGHSGQDHCT